MTQIVYDYKAMLTVNIPYPKQSPEWCSPWYCNLPISHWPMVLVACRHGMWWIYALTPGWIRKKIDLRSTKTKLTNIELNFKLWFECQVLTLCQNVHANFPLHTHIMWTLALLNAFQLSTYCPVKIIHIKISNIVRHTHSVDVVWWQVLYIAYINQSTFCC